jgi:hypothetical protein
MQSKLARRPDLPAPLTPTILAEHLVDPPKKHRIVDLTRTLTRKFVHCLHADRVANEANTLVPVVDILDSADDGSSKMGNTGFRDVPKGALE